LYIQIYDLGERGTAFQVSDLNLVSNQQGHFSHRNQAVQFRLLTRPISVADSFAFLTVFSFKIDASRFPVLFA
jgi:hypothetical protein